MRTEPVRAAPHHQGVADDQVVIELFLQSLEESEAEVTTTAEAATAVQQSWRGDGPGSPRGGQTAEPVPLFNLCCKQSQPGSAALEDAEAERPSSPLSPQLQDRLGEVPPQAIPTIALQPPLTSSGPPSPRSRRVQDLEGMVHDLRTEVARLREEVATMATVTSMARDEAQHAVWGMDQMKLEWLLWSVGGPKGYQPHLSPDRLGRRGH